MTEDYWEWITNIVDNHRYIRSETSRARVKLLMVSAFLKGEKVEHDREKERILKLLTKEINIAHQEGTPTARLTSLYNKI